MGMRPSFNRSFSPPDSGSGSEEAESDEDNAERAAAVRDMARQDHRSPDETRSGAGERREGQQEGGDNEEEEEEEERETLPLHNKNSSLSFVVAFRKRLQAWSG